MEVKKRTIHRKKSFTIPVAIVAGFMPAVMDVKNNVNNFGGWGGSAIHTLAGLTGYDTVSKKYAGLSQMQAAGLYPIIAGFAIHWGASKLGINRMLARSRIPFIRI
jgi:hypothetical protein